jgi:MinD superfamily P-loop ATPase
MQKPIEIAVVSGKGGTGKTVLTSALAFLADSKVTADCDVDAPDMHLLLQPEVRHEEDFMGNGCARIDELKCTACGKCAEVCRYDAVRVGNGDGPAYSVDPLECEGCGVCVWMCPREAIELRTSAGGKWFVSDTRFGKLVHAQLNPAQENSGKLVTLVRREARLMAEREGLALVIIDGPPGIGCPVIASIAGADVVVVVTEPTMSGLHDLDRVFGLAAHFGLRPAVVVNKYDLNHQVSDSIERRVLDGGGLFMGRIPFAAEVKDAVAAGKTILEYDGGDVSGVVRAVAARILSMAAATRKSSESPNS